MSRRLRFAIWTVLAGLILGGQLLWIWLLRGHRILSADVILIGGHILISLLLLGMFSLLCSTPANALRLSRPTSHAIILIGAAGLHLAALVLLWPALSEDVIRYRLEGRMWLSGVSPYATSPEAFLNRRPHDADAVDRMVTFPTMQTIYPPITQLVFIAGRAVEQVVAPGLTAAGLRSDRALDDTLRWRQALAGLDWLGRGGIFRLIMAAVALLATAVALRLLAEMNASPWWAAIFAWHPLLVVETAGNAHSDIIGVLLLLVILLDLHRGRYLAAAVALGLACCVKPHAIVLLPFVWREAQQRIAGSARAGLAHGTDESAEPHAHWRVPVVVALVMAALYLPAMALDDGWRGWLTTARTYARHWEANGSVYELLKAWIGGGDDHRIVLAKRLSRGVQGLGLLVAGALLWRRRAGVAEAGGWMMLIGLLLAAVVYPWYLLWVLVFVPFMAARAVVGGGAAWAAWPGLVWAATIVLSYLLWRQPAWRLPAAVTFAEYAPVYLAAAAALVRGLMPPRIQPGTV